VQEVEDFPPDVQAVTSGLQAMRGR
jgi:hypothetical protein